MINIKSQNVSIFKKYGKICYELAKYIPYFLSFFIDMLSKSIFCFCGIYFSEKIVISEKFVAKAAEFLLPKILLKETNLLSDILKYKQNVMSAVIFLVAINIVDIFIKPLYKIFPTKKDMLHHQVLTGKQVEEEARIYRNLKKAETVKERFKEAHAMSKTPIDDVDSNEKHVCGLKEITEQLSATKPNIELPGRI